MARPRGTPNKRCDYTAHPIVQALRRIRIAQHTTQMDLSATVGCGHTTIGRMERGEFNPSFLSVIDIANALGYDLELKPRAKPHD